MFCETLSFMERAVFQHGCRKRVTEHLQSLTNQSEHETKTRDRVASLGKYVILRQVFEKRAKTRTTSVAKKGGKSS